MCGMHYRKYYKNKWRNTPETSTTKLPFRQDSLVNSDKKERREKGRELPRRTYTRLATEGQETCKYRFLIAWDKYRFYLKQTTGNSFHNGHPQFAHEDIAIPARLIPEEEKQFLLHLAQSCAGMGIGSRNYLYTKIGKFLTKASIQHLQNETLVGVDPDDPNKLPTNDVEGLLQFFKSTNNISYQVLWDISAQAGSVTEDPWEHLLVSTK